MAKKKSVWVVEALPTEKRAEAEFEESSSVIAVCSTEKRAEAKVTEEIECGDFEDGELIITEMDLN